MKSMGSFLVALTAAALLLVGPNQASAEALEDVPWWQVNNGLAERAPGAACKAGPDPEIQRYPLETVAQLPPVLDFKLVFGDTDHDGRYEVISYRVTGFEASTHILEYQGGGVYSDAYLGAALVPEATGDLDGDGRSDFVGSAGGRLYVYESLDSNSYPTELVWVSPQMSAVGNSVAIGDTDRDGRMEMLHSENGFAGHGSVLRIFECTADNTYTQVFAAPPTLDGGTDRKIIADFDGDGLMEIAFFATPHIYVYESPGDDTWRLEWVGATEIAGGDSDGGVDTDGNGKIELFVNGNGPSGRTTIVFEAAGIDSFARVTSFAKSDGSTGISVTTVARLAPGQPPVFIMNGAFAAWCYQSRTPGKWHYVGRITAPTAQKVSGAFDVNRNGRDEIFWTREFGPSLVLEQAQLTVDVPDRRPGFQLRVSPNPCRDTTEIQVLGSASSAGMQVLLFDVAGRRLLGPEPLVLPGLGLRWSTEGLATGTYFLRLDDARGRTCGVQRLTVVR